MAFHEQLNVVCNPLIGCVFFEDQGLCYNYKTDQWTRIVGLIPSVVTKHHLFSISSRDGLIGSIEAETGAIETHFFGYQDQDDGVAQTSVLETAETDLSQGGRTFLSGVRPLLNKTTATSVTVSIGERDDLSENVVYHTLASVNSRTGRHDGRVDGRYLRTRFSITGGFDTVLGEDIDSTPSGSV